MGTASRRTSRGRCNGCGGRCRDGCRLLRPIRVVRGGRICCGAPCRVRSDGLLLALSLLYRSLCLRLRLHLYMRLGLSSSRSVPWMILRPLVCRCTTASGLRNAGIWGRSVPSLRLGLHRRCLRLGEVLIL